MPVARASESDAHSAPPTLLVADDMPDVALVLGKLLEAFGYRVICRHSAHEALQVLAERADIALVISDVRMPGLDGFDLARVLRSRFPALPVLLVSGMAGNGGDVGPEGFAVLPKPIDPVMLERVVKEALAATA